MGRRTVQMALMRMGVPSSATSKVGTVFISYTAGSPCSGVSGCILAWLVGCGLGFDACDVVYWFLLSLALGLKCCQKGTGLALW